MNQKERLVEVLDNAFVAYVDARSLEPSTPFIADKILADGWMRPPCKCGDTIYYFSHRPFNISLEANTIYEATVVRIVTTRLGTQLVIQIRNEWGCTEVPDIRSWGKTVFLTREEAEKALRGGDDE